MKVNNLKIHLFLGIIGICILLILGIYALFQTLIYPQNNTRRAFAAGNTFYVSTTGVDSGTCSSVSPCQTLQFASSQANAGDTVLVESGDYGPQKVFYKSGTLNNPITIKAQGAVTLIRPLPLTDLLQSTNLLDINGDSYITFDGFNLVGTKNQTGYNQNDSPYGGEVMIECHTNTPCTNVTIQNFTVYDANNTCIKDQDGNEYNSILNNTVYNCGSPLDGSHDHGIYLGGGGQDGDIVQGNTSYNNTGWGIHLHSCNGQNVLIKNNIVHDNGVIGIIDDCGAGPTIFTGNIVYNNLSGGIEMYPNSTATYNLLVNNGIVAGGGAFGLSFEGSGGGNFVVENNTFYYNYGSNINMGSPGSAVVENNIIFKDPNSYFAPWLDAVAYRGTIPNPQVKIDYNDYVNTKPINGCNGPASCTGQNYDGGHSLNLIDPKFVNPNNLNAIAGDFHLQSGSPAIGAGNDLGLPCQYQKADLGELNFNCYSAPYTSPTPKSMSTPMPTPTPTLTPTPKSTPIPTPTPSSSPTSTSTSTPTPNSTAVLTPISSATTVSNPTPSPTNNLPGITSSSITSSNKINQLNQVTSGTNTQNNKIPLATITVGESSTSNNLGNDSSIPTLYAAESNSVNKPSLYKTYNLHLKIVDKNNIPVKNAEVIIHSKVVQVKTDSTGFAYFQNIATGNHILDISYEFKTTEQIIRVTGNQQNIDILVKLNQSSMDFFIIIGLISFVTLLVPANVFLIFMYKYPNKYIYYLSRIKLFAIKVKSNLVKPKV